MATAPDVLLLPAFDDLPGLPGEASQWADVYDFEDSVPVNGVPNPVQVASEGVALVPTGVGKVAAATTTATLLSSDALDLSETLFLTVGVAGGPPDVPIGSVVVADTIVDWDDKCRFDPEDGLAMNPYTEGQGCYELEEDRVQAAMEAARDIELTTPQEDSEHDDPRIVRGTNLCGDELWHGERPAEEAAWLTDQYGVDPHLATEMEDAATAAVLERFDCLDRYLCVRGISNHDRPTGDRDARENFFGDDFEAGFETGIQNAVRVARAIICEGSAVR